MGGGGAALWLLSAEDDKTERDGPREGITAKQV
jgi:hypothetical protein